MIKTVRYRPMKGETASGGKKRQRDTKEHETETEPEAKVSDSYQGRRDRARD